MKTIRSLLGGFATSIVGAVGLLPAGLDTRIIGIDPALPDVAPARAVFADRYANAQLFSARVRAARGPEKQRLIRKRARACARRVRA